MNQQIHAAQYVAKADSQLPDAFTSLPAGPLGHLRGGQPCWYYHASPPAPGHSWLPTLAYQHLAPPDLQRRQRVVIWTCTVSAYFPAAQLLGADAAADVLPLALDGLILSGSGTGSLPASLIEQLAPWTRRLPIVIVSRCGAGANHDDWHYRGSRQKYESRGFLLGDGYEQLTPLQARCLLLLRLAAFGHA